MTRRDAAIDRVLELATRYWENNGDYLRQAADVGRSWEDYPQCQVSDPITRGELLLEAKNLDRKDMRGFFVRVMAWGHGPSGYAAYRVNRILQVLDAVADSGSVRLINWISQLRAEAKGGPEKAFEFLGSDVGCIKYLGPSFSTKVLYFLSPEGNRAPILDAVVNSWLWRQGVASRAAPIELDHQDHAGYSQWVQFCDDALAHLKGRSRKQFPDDRGFIEYLVFQDQSRYVANLGLASWIRASD